MNTVINNRIVELEKEIDSLEAPKLKAVNSGANKNPTINTLSRITKAFRAFT